MVYNLLDAVEELHVRMIDGDTLEQAKQNTIWLEELTEQEKDFIDKFIHDIKLFGFDESEAINFLYEEMKKYF